MKIQMMGLIVLCISLFSCSKSGIETTVVNPSDLSQDPNFIQVVNQEKELSSFISHLATEKGLTGSALRNKIDSLHDYDLNSANETSNLSKFLGVNNIIYLKNCAKDYKTAWANLNAKYNYISMQNIDEACKNLYGQQYNRTLVNTGTIDRVATNALLEVNKVNDCGWKYAICMAATTSGAILCHAGCITATAGIGAPVCVLLCGTIEVAAGVACTDNYCPLP